jgi:hypothetical protein
MLVQRSLYALVAHWGYNWRGLASVLDSACQTDRIVVGTGYAEPSFFTSAKTVNAIGNVSSKFKQKSDDSLTIFIFLSLSESSSFSFRHDLLLLY